jgi:2',3'-cyclic-nucleotide 2'-phosphodiesterase (5'-nucleotidase family)
VYELYPFDNRIVTLRLTGDQLTRVIAYTLERKVGPFELLPIAGFKVDAKCSGNMLRVTLTRSSGVPIRADERLTVATSDFIAGGGDGIVAPAGALGEIKIVEGAPLLRESFVAWLRNRGGRLNENQFVSAEHRRWSYPGSRPVVCQ